MHGLARVQCLTICMVVQGIAAIDARENAPKDTTHSAVKAIKYRLAKARKSPAADLEDEDDAEMEAEGSERQLQASATSAQSYKGCQVS